MGALSCIAIWRFITLGGRSWHLGKQHLASFFDAFSWKCVKSWCKGSWKDPTIYFILNEERQRIPLRRCLVLRSSFRTYIPDSIRYIEKLIIVFNILISFIQDSALYIVHQECVNMLSRQYTMTTYTAISEAVYSAQCLSSTTGAFFQASEGIKQFFLLGCKFCFSWSSSRPLCWLIKRKNVLCSAIMDYCRVCLVVGVSSRCYIQALRLWHTKTMRIVLLSVNAFAE